jgi:DNA-directed RNA polymerase specialized sigma24 family protein
VHGSRDAEFTDFVAEHGGHLLRTACLVTGDAHLGEDLLQTALAKASGHGPRCATPTTRPRTSAG